MTTRPKGTSTQAVEVWLAVTRDGRRTQVPSDGSTFVIGRGATCGLVIAHPSCSREQASIRFEGGALWLEPLSTHQPTLVNGTAQERAVRVSSGDVVRFGETEIRIDIVDGSRAHTPRFAPPEGATFDRTEIASDAASLAAPPPLTGAINVSRHLVLGRRADHTLDHPTVSARHAVVAPHAAGLTVRDLGSTNGTFVNGTRVDGSKTYALSNGDLVRIGPFTLRVEGTTLVPLEAGGDDAQLTAHALVLEVDNAGTPTRLLNEVSIGIRASEFVAIIGPSGCGKSTLIRVLSGRSSPTSGVVSWNATDLHRSFDALKSDIAFVPQRETLPELLTVRQALTYTGRLRLPPDTTATELRAQVEKVISTVGLEKQAETVIAKLSGGQRKRASLANELILSPKLMFLDEVTSGLDEATDADMMKLFRSLADQKIAVICVTHTLANVEGTVDSLLIMARGGTVAYHGPLSGAKAHFGVEKYGEIYGALARRDGPEWKQYHAAASPYRRRAENAKVVGAGAPKGLGAPIDRRRPLSQLAVLLERYLEITFADRRTLLMAGAQSIVIAGFLRLVFGGGELVPARESLLVFLLGISAFWFGCNNAAKEIVKERALFHLERDVNLRIPSYIWSKVAVLGFIGVLQTALLFAGVRLLGSTFGHPGPIFGMMVLTLLSGTTCGLLISAASASEDQAITIVPIALIPQLLLSDAVISPLTKAAEVVAKTGITTYWAYRGERSILGMPGIDGRFAIGMLVAHVVGYAALALVILAWRERSRRR